MFVTNLTNGRLGVDGIIHLGPREENRFLEDTPDLVARVKRLKQAKLVDVRFEEGLVKPEPVQEEVKAAVEADVKEAAPVKEEVADPAPAEVKKVVAKNRR